MKRLFLSLFIFITGYIPVQAQCGFYFRGLGTSLNKVRFWDENTGIILGYQSALLRTTDGGHHWINAGIPMFQSLFNNPLNDICIVDGTTAYVVGDYGLILKTTDKGATWKRLLGITGIESFSAVFFTSTLTGFVAGKEGLIYKTTDGGNNWRQISLNYTGNLIGVCFADSQHGFAWGLGNYNSPRTFMTKDGGTTWEQFSSLDNQAVKQVQFLNATTGYLSVIYANPGNVDPSILKTTDGGLHWSRVGTQVYYTDMTFNFLDEQTGYITTAGGVRKTTNGGLSYSIVFPTTNTNFVDLHFLNNNVGYGISSSNFFVGGNGRFITKTIDGGQHWEMLDTLVSWAPNIVFSKEAQDLVEVNPLTKFLSTNAGDVYVSRDGGSSWRCDLTLTRDTLQYSAKKGLLLKNDSLLYILDRRFYVTGDGGLNWISRDLNLPDTVTRVPFNMFGALSTPDTIFFTGTLNSNGKFVMLITQNRARTWQVIPLPYGIFIDLEGFAKFTNKVTGYIYGTRNGKREVYRTDNAGITWENLRYPDSTNYYGFEPPGQVLNDSTLIISGSDHFSFYKSTNRGVSWTKIPLPSSMVSNSRTIHRFRFYSEKTGVLSSDNHVYITTDSAKTWFLQLAGLVNNGIIKGIRFIREDKYYAFGTNLRVDQFENYTPSKPDLIKGPATIAINTPAMYIIPLDLFSYDTKWEATGNPQITYDSSQPERVVFKWPAPGTYTVSAYAKNYCGISPPATYTVTVSLFTGLPPVANSGIDFLLYPVPAQDKMYLKIKKPGKYKYAEIVDISGRMLFQKNIENQQNIEFDLKSYSKGLYFFRIISAGSKQVFSSKLIIQ